MQMFLLLWLFPVVSIPVSLLQFHPILLRIYMHFLLAYEGNPSSDERSKASYLAEHLGIPFLHQLRFQLMTLQLFSTINPLYGFTCC